MRNRAVYCRSKSVLKVLSVAFPCFVFGLVGPPAFAQPNVEGKWVAPVGGLDDGVQEPVPADYGWPLAGVDAALLSTGKVLVWNLGFSNDPQANCFSCKIECNIVKLWNPADGSFADAFCNVCVGCLHCPGHASLKDGSLLVAGGGNSQDPVNETRIFQLTAPGGWMQVTPMNLIRWYPTATTLPDGRVLLIAGKDGIGNIVLTPEVYDPGPPETWTHLAVLTQGIAKLYPFMFLLPDGKVFYAGGGRGLQPPNPSTGTYTLDTQSTPPAWDPFPEPNNASFFRGDLGAAVMYQPGKVLKCGGNIHQEEPPDLIIQQTAIIDTTAANPVWESQVPAWDMPEPRNNHNLVLLPDGQILLVGGHDGANFIKDARLFDPIALEPVWVNMADMVGQSHF